MNIQNAPTAAADIPLLRSDEGPIAILTLNRPAARNSLSEALLVVLDEALQAIAKDGGRAYFQHIMTMCSTMMQRIVALPQPVIAAVQGVASAAGCQLVASCDLAVAGTEAGFATPGVDIGLFCSTPMVALSRNIARKHAMQMLFMGDIVPAERAAAMGLVNEVVPAGQERAKAIEWAQMFASKSSHVVGIGKAAFYRQVDMPLAEAYDYASKVMTENMMARDAEEGICAFIEKRDPTWEDR